MVHHTGRRTDVVVSRDPARLLDSAFTDDLGYIEVPGLPRGLVTTTSIVGLAAHLQHLPDPDPHGSELDYHLQIHRILSNFPKLFEDIDPNLPLDRSNPVFLELIESLRCPYTPVALFKPWADVLPDDDVGMVGWFISGSLFDLYSSAWGTEDEIPPSEADARILFRRIAQTQSGWRGALNAAAA